MNGDRRDGLRLNWNESKLSGGDLHGAFSCLALPTCRYDLTFRGTYRLLYSAGTPNAWVCGIASFTNSRQPSWSSNHRGQGFEGGEGVERCALKDNMLPLELLEENWWRIQCF